MATEAQTYWWRKALRQRTRNLALLVMVFLLDFTAMAVARAPHDSAVSVLTVAALAGSAGLLASLAAGKGDRGFRLAVLCLILAYSGFKLWMYVDFVRSAD